MRAEEFATLKFGVTRKINTARAVMKEVEREVLAKLDGCIAGTLTRGGVRRNVGRNGVGI